jgi:hypothetical protein
MNFRIIKRINYYLDWYSYRKGIDITSAYDTILRLKELYASI